MKHYFSLIILIFSTFAPVSSLVAKSTFDKAKAFTVNVYSYARKPFYEAKAGMGEGSGFVIDSKKKLIMTNAHVAASGDVTYEIKTYDGLRYEARLIASDPFFDLAVLQITEKLLKPLKQAELYDSKRIHVGQQVTTLGNPSGFEFNLSNGVISALDDIERFSGIFRRRLIRTDAFVGHGNSGGPLLDKRTGKVLGINSYGFGDREDTPKGLGFAADLESATPIIEAVKAVKEIPLHAWIGIRGKTPTLAEMERSFGKIKLNIPLSEKLVQVHYVYPHSPGFNVLRTGDLILSLGKESRRPNTLTQYQQILDQHLDQEMSVKVLRQNDGGYQVHTLKVIPKPLCEPVEEYVEVSGAVVHEYYPYLRFRNGDVGFGRGVYLSYYDYGSEFDSTEAHEKDIIFAVDGKPTNNLKSFYEALEIAQKNKREANLSIYKPDYSTNNPIRLSSIKVKDLKLVRAKSD